MLMFLRPWSRFQQFFGATKSPWSVGSLVPGPQNWNWWVGKRSTATNIDPFSSGKSKVIEERLFQTHGPMVFQFLCPELLNSKKKECNFTLVSWIWRAGSIATICYLIIFAATPHSLRQEVGERTALLEKRASVERKVHLDGFFDWV